MRDWERSTRACKLGEISPELAAAIRQHVDTYNLGPILDDALACVETVSIKRKRRLIAFSGDREMVGCAIVTPVWLVWATAGKKAGAAALSGRLTEMVVTPYAETPMAARMPESGLMVEGELTGRVGMHGSRRVTGFIWLGEGPAGERFMETLREAWLVQRR